MDYKQKIWLVSLALSQQSLEMLLLDQDMEMINKKKDLEEEEMKEIEIGTPQEEEIFQTIKKRIMHGEINMEKIKERNSIDILLEKIGLIKRDSVEVVKEEFKITIVTEEECRANRKVRIISLHIGTEIEAVQLVEIIYREETGGTIMIKDIMWEDQDKKEIEVEADLDQGMAGDLMENLGDTLVQVEGTVIQAPGTDILVKGEITKTVLLTGKVHLINSKGSCPGKEEMQNIARVVAGILVVSTGNNKREEEVFPGNPETEMQTVKEAQLGLNFKGGSEVEAERHQLREERVVNTQWEVGWIKIQENLF